MVVESLNDIVMPILGVVLEGWDNNRYPGAAICARPADPKKQRHNLNVATLRRFCISRICGSVVRGGNFAQNGDGFAERGTSAVKPEKLFVGDGTGRFTQ